MIRALAVAGVLALVAAGTARADWTGDDVGDVLAVEQATGILYAYPGAGAGTFRGDRLSLGGGWEQFDLVVAPGDFSGDGPSDLLARRPDGDLLLYRGDGAGGFAAEARPAIGNGWQSIDAVLTPGDFSGDGKADLLGRSRADGTLLLYRGAGDGRFVGTREVIGTGWGQFDALVAPGDFSGDGYPDVLARTPAGELLLYRGNGAGAFHPGAARVGLGFAPFTALIGGDFTNDGKPDLLVRAPDGRLVRYAGDGDGGFAEPGGVPIGDGWGPFGSLMLAGGRPPGVAPSNAPPLLAAPPTDTTREIRLRTGLGCTPAGGRLPVSLTVKRPTGERRARVRRVVFFVEGGQRRTDRRAPWRVRLRATTKPGASLRVYARVVFKRPGRAKLQRQTVSRRYRICA